MNFAFTTALPCAGQALGIFVGLRILMVPHILLRSDYVCYILLITHFARRLTSALSTAPQVLVCKHSPNSGYVGRCEAATLLRGCRRYEPGRHGSKDLQAIQSEEDLFSWLRVGLLPRLYADFAAESEHAQNAWYRDFQSDFHGKPMRNHGFP